MSGWQKLAHEKATALRIAESIQLKTLDGLFSNKSIAELTETQEVKSDNWQQQQQQQCMEIDSYAFDQTLLSGSCIDYTDQRYGMVLTGSSVPAPEYTQLKSGLIEVDSSRPVHGKGIALQDYLRTSTVAKYEPL